MPDIDMNRPLERSDTFLPFQMMHEAGPIENVRVVDVTRAAAVAVKPWVGRGLKNEADQAAVAAMRRMLNREIPVRGTVVIGEGERDKAPMLYIGEEVGIYRRLTPYELTKLELLDSVPEGMDPFLKLSREDLLDLGVFRDVRKRKIPEERWMTDEELRELGIPVVDIATDPLEGTTPAAYNLEGATTVMAMAERGTVLHAPDIYMEKLVVGPSAAGQVDLRAPVKENLEVIRRSLRRDSVHDLNIVVMNRGRNKALIDEIRSCGATVKLIEDCDMMRGIAAAIRGSQIHALFGIGAAPEGVLTAIAIKALGGEIQARLVSRNVNHRDIAAKDDAAEDTTNAFAFSQEEIARMKRMKVPEIEKVLEGEKIFHTEDLCSSKDFVFGATGVTTGDLLKGVIVFQAGGAITDSLKIGGSGIFHTIKTIYIKDKKRNPVRMPGS